MGMPAQPSASGKLGKVEKGIGKNQLVVCVQFWMSLGSAALCHGREMVGWERLVRRKPSIPGGASSRGNFGG